MTRLIVERVTSGLRIKLERLFAADMRRVISNLLKVISKEANKRGLFEIASRDAARYKDREERRQRANEVLPDIFLELENELLNSTERRVFQRYYRMWYRRLFELGAVDTLKLMGFNARSKLLDQFIKRREISKAAEDTIVFELTAKELINDLEARSIQFGAGITAEIIKDARRIVRDNIYLGNVSTFEVGQLIARSTFIPQWRGLKIARTESHVAYSTAVFEESRRSGVKQHFWINVGDGKVREWHVINGLAGPILIGEPFPSGQIQPGEGTAELVINCRCSTQPDLSDPNLLLEPWDGGDILFVQETGVRHFDKFLGERKALVVKNLLEAISIEKAKKIGDEKLLTILQYILSKIYDGTIAEI